MSVSPSIEDCIFPILVFESIKKTFTCLGTGFFIGSDGWFVTANHVLNDNIGEIGNEIIGIQSLNESEKHVRFVTHYTVHDIGDIVIGKLGEAHDISRQRIPTIKPAITTFDFSELHEGEELVSYGYPKTTSAISGTKTTFNFKYRRYTGRMTEKLEKAPKLNYPCYQTNINFESGSSGGPVFKENAAVVGIHTASFDLLEGEPISFITPISMILDLPIMNDKGHSVPFHTVLQRSN